MGTRGIIYIQHEEELRVALYNHMDSYPSELGKSLKTFLRNKEVDLDHLRNQLSKVQLVAVDTPDREHVSGHELLEVLYNWDKAEPLKLEDWSGFEIESWSCEWCYVVNLDTEEIEVYKGKNKDKPLKAGDRFYHNGRNSFSGFYPCYYLFSYSFDHNWVDPSDKCNSENSDKCHSTREIKSVRL